MRPIDPFFAAGEVLYRSIGRGDVARGAVKGSSLRLHVSVQRDAHGGTVATAGARDAARAGVATITARDVWALPAAGGIRAACVDDPLGADESHAMIAFVSIAEPATEDTETMKRQLREHLAASFAVRVPPPR